MKICGTGDTVTSRDDTLMEKKDESDKTIMTRITTTSIKYNKISSEVISKEERFLSLLRTDPQTNEFNKKNITKNKNLVKYINANGKKSSPEDNLLSSEQVLFSYLASYDQTQSFEEIMRYLFYIYTGNSYGRTTFDFSIYEPDEFTSVSYTMYGGSIQEKVWFALKDLGFKDIVISGAMGNIDYESSGFTTTAVEKGSGNGIGLIQWSFSRRNQLEAYAASKGVSWTDEDTQVEFLIAEISGQGPASSYATRRTKGYIGSEGASRTATVSDWENATTIEESTLAFMRFFESPASIDSYSERRARAERYYSSFKDLVRGGGDYSQDGITSQYVIGTFISSLSGRTFTIFNQNKIPGWGDKCNRAAQISVCSGYYSGESTALISLATNSSPQNASMYNNNGLIYKTGTTNLDLNTIRNQIQSGGYIIPYLKGRTAGATGLSKYGRKWASSMHWVAILGYKVENGQELMFVSDSGHGNTGWVPIDEFDGMVSATVFVNERT